MFLNENHPRDIGKEKENVDDLAEFDNEKETNKTEKEIKEQKENEKKKAE